MSDQILWYAARISGLMAWITACGALICALLLRSQRRRQPTAADEWVWDAYRFLGSATVAFVIVHGSAIVLDARFDVSPTVVFARSAGAWVGPGLLLGVIGAWLLLATAALRFFADRLQRVVEGAIIATTLAVVVAGAAHAWRLGSDVRSPFALVVLALVTLAVLLAATLSFGASGLEMHHPTAGDQTIGRTRRRRSPRTGSSQATDVAARRPGLAGQSTRRDIPLPELRLSRTVASTEIPRSAQDGPAGPAGPRAERPGPAVAGVRDDPNSALGPAGAGSRHDPTTPPGRAERRRRADRSTRFRRRPR